jgi:hypothetical protein
MSIQLKHYHVNNFLVVLPLIFPSYLTGVVKNIKKFLLSPALVVG